MRTGKVYLIGAGPGDPELMTLKAAGALAEAQWVIVDDLVSRACLRFAPRARVIEAGKRAGCRSTPQAFIERRMVRLARAGFVVARLKGGDPFVFGRGGEELVAMRRAGIECEIVPGVTSALGVAAALGVPLTHREHAHGVTFVAGHLRDGSQPDWGALARSGTTLVVYMGMGKLAAISRGLLEAGMPGATPAAVVQHGTLPQQKSVVTTLARLHAEVGAAGLGSPALLVVGPVVALARTAPAADALRFVA